MAFGCVIHLKSECDGCGMCEEPYHGFKPARVAVSDDTYDPMEIDYDDER